MSGKRISREKLTIKKMIDLYQDRKSTRLLQSL